jgi:IclR family pca regulon transcriptional regulator
MSPQAGDLSLREGEAARSMQGMCDPRFSQSLERGLAVLGVFRPARCVLGVSELAEELGMSRSTTHRYVRTLVALGYLEQVAQRKYRLGLRVMDLGMTALTSTPLREHAHPYLLELCERSSFTVSLGVLDGSELLYVDRVRSFRPSQIMRDLDLHPGSRVPAYCTAMGKLLLASLSELEQRELLSVVRLSKRAPNTITRKKVLREELERITVTGLAGSDQELSAGIVAIAVAVRNEAREVVAAVGMAADSSTLSVEGLADALGPHLRAGADRISARLGYRRYDEIPGAR